MRTVLVLLLSVSALSACGLRGDLVRPMPLWGDPPLDGPTDPRVIAAAKKAEEDAKANRQAPEAPGESAPDAETPPQ